MPQERTTVPWIAASAAAVDDHAHVDQFRETSKLVPTQQEMSVNMGTFETNVDDLNDLPVVGNARRASDHSGPPLSGPTMVAIADIRPTQITVGYREVAVKRRRWRKARRATEYCRDEHRAVPVVIGPGAVYYAVDCHHWLCAVAAEGVVNAQVAIVADLHDLDQPMFWLEMDRRGWCRAYDADGHRQDYRQIPSSISGLKDDPFRSLAGALRRAGGYRKDQALFSEFAWADFLRGFILAADLDDEFDEALQAALLVSQSVGGVSSGCASQPEKASLP